MPCATAQPWPIPPGVKTVDVGGYPLAYVEAGSGVPIVIVHGSWVDHRVFAGQVAEFSKTNRVIAVSLRHSWPEPWDGKTGDFSIDRHADDLVALVRRLDLGKVHLLGHSRGGAVALGVARRAPEAIRTLILAEPSGFYSAFVAPDVRRQMVERLNQLAAWVRSNQDSVPRRELTQRAWDMANGQGSWDRMPPGVQQMFADNIGTMAAPTSLDLPSVADCDDLRRFTFPVLLLNGERSPKPYADLMAAMRACKPALSPVVVVPEAGHNMQLQNPAFFNKAVLDFVQAN
jgi:pimeloyl-ACP methyl ester carboxylesterase